MYRIEPKEIGFCFPTDIVGYDHLIIATGAKIKPEETEGLKEDLGIKAFLIFITVEGACALRDFFKNWEGGKLVLTLPKCQLLPGLHLWSFHS